MNTYIIKCLTKHFNAIRDGITTSISIRDNGRKFQPGDVLNFIEVTGENKYPGNRVCRKIKSLTVNREGIASMELAIPEN